MNNIFKICLQIILSILGLFKNKQDLKHIETEEIKIAVDIAEERHTPEDITRALDIIRNRK